MNCRKCGTLIKEGEYFCRKCATPVETIDTNVKLVKQKTNFINMNKLNDVEKKIKLMFEPKYKEQPFVPGKLSNKELIYKDANNRKQATIENITSAALIILILLIVIFVIYIVISKL